MKLLRCERLRSVNACAMQRFTASVAYPRPQYSERSAQPISKSGQPSGSHGPNAADECAGLTLDDREQAESAQLSSGRPSRTAIATTRTANRPAVHREKLHHPGVGATSPRSPRNRRGPPAQDQSVGFQHAIHGALVYAGYFASRRAEAAKTHGGAYLAIGISSVPYCPVRLSRTNDADRLQRRSVASIGGRARSHSRARPRAVRRPTRPSYARVSCLNPPSIVRWTIMMSRSATEVRSRCSNTTVSESISRGSIQGCQPPAGRDAPCIQADG